MKKLNSNEAPQWLKDELTAIYKTNYAGSNVSAVSEGMAEFIHEKFKWIKKGMIQDAFTAMIVHRVTPMVDHKYCFNLQYVSEVLWNYKRHTMKGASTQAQHIEPTTEHKRKIETEAIEGAFKRFKEKGKVFLLHVHYNALKRRYGLEDNWQQFTAAAKAAKLLQKEAAYAQAERDFDRHAMRSLREELKDFAVAGATLEDAAKGLAVKAFFETLIQQNKTL